MEISLKGRSAVVTGASQGLGFAMAKAFAEAGADVAILARRKEPLEEARRALAASAKGRVAAISCDVADAAGIAGAYEAVMGEFGKVDILVNNAGKSATGAFESLSDADWQADLDLKLFAAIRFCRLVLPQMKERRWGRIINALNIGAKAPRARSAPTSVSRAAGMALTKVLAGEGAPYNVLVNALLVGLIVTDQIVRRHRADGANLSLEDFIAKAGAAVPLGRMGRAEEFASLACLLVSDAGGFVTDTAINVDGGMSPVV
ncbi:MAG TPA: SDR family NAD(P)-dependent oxidoreductase [Stellaceae bacterium]|nr:SDR family NAD(P)-dependent oxidoreductase [Stellaceae bacterium]